MGRASIIEAYIQQLLAWDKPITPNALKSLAHELGITAGEVAAIRLKVKKHLGRSRSYFDTEDLDNAIEEVVQASNLAPVDPDVLNTLAELYYERYKKESNLADRQQTLLMAKRCLELYPNNKRARALRKHLMRTTGYQVISRQQRPKVFTMIELVQKCTDPSYLSWLAQDKLTDVYHQVTDVVSQIPKPSSSAQSKLAPFAGYMAIATLTFVGLSRVTGFSSPPTPTTVISNATLLSDQSTATSEAVEELAEVPVFNPGPNIPVTFHHPGLFIEPRLSRLGEYDGADYYKLDGLLINDSGQEVRRLNLKLELLNGDGLAIATVNQTAIRNDSIRPGDTLPFELFHKITPELIRVRVSVTDIEQVVANSAPDDQGLWQFEDNNRELISRNEGSAD